MAKIHVAHAFDILVTWRHIPLSPKEMLTLLAIATCTDDQGIASLPTEALACIARTTVPTVHRLVRQLEEKGCLAITPAPSPEGNQRYRVVHNEEWS